MSDDRLTDAIQGFLTELANLISAQATRMDLELVRQLEALGARTIELRCEEPQLAWSVTIEEGFVQVASGPGDTPHAIVTGAPGDLLAWMTGGDANVQIDGDVTLVDEFVSICKTFSPNIGQPFESAFNNEFVQGVIGAAEMGIRTLTSVIRDVGQAAKDRAQREWTDTGQVDDFIHEIDELRLRVDRLAARVSARERNDHH